jgi:hypothetical protein
MRKLYSFGIDYGRQGYLEGLFIAEEKDVAELVGKEVYFGEVLGKHSEVVADMEESFFKVIDVPANVVQILEEKIGVTISGYNPFDFIEEEE